VFVVDGEGQSPEVRIWSSGIEGKKRCLSDLYVAKQHFCGSSANTTDQRQGARALMTSTRLRGILGISGSKRSALIEYDARRKAFQIHIILTSSRPIYRRVEEETA
jgi:hypothetical protein